jgi:hypothetical protein
MPASPKILPFRRPAPRGTPLPARRQIVRQSATVDGDTALLQHYEAMQRAMIATSDLRL